MKSKILLIVVLLFIASIGNLYAKNSYYTIQLAVVKQKDGGIEDLKSEAEKLNSKLLKEVRIVSDDKFYILFALITTSELKAKDLLPKYKNIFKDAYIRKHDPSKVQLIKSYKSTATNIKLIKPKEIKQAPIEPIKNNLKFTNAMLVNHTVYALYTKGNKKDDIALVALELLNDFTMNFRVILGEKHKGEGNYFIDFQGRFYIYSDENSRYKNYYTLVEKNKSYMKVSAWEDGVKNKNEVYFFYSISLAKEYIDSLIKK